MEENLDVTDKMEGIPIVTLRDLVVFPKTTVYFEVGRENTVKALKEAMNGRQLVFTVAQKDPSVETPGMDDLFETGTLAEVKQIVNMPGKIIRVVISGRERMKLMYLESMDGYMAGTLENIPETKDTSYTLEIVAMIRGLKDLFQVYANANGRFNQKLVDEILNITDLDTLIYQISSNIPVNYQIKQKILSEDSIIDRHEQLSVVLSRETGIARIQDDIARRVKSQVESNQREYYLREQMKAIHKELGEDDSDSDADRYTEALKKLKAPKKVKKKLAEEIRRFKITSSSSSENAVIRGYIETLLDIPWKKESKSNTDVVRASGVLDKEHYGLEKVKERVLECLAVKAIKKDGQSPVICLTGPPGTGKTSIAKSVAKSMDRKYVRICLGGVRDEAEIRGHRRTYVGAMPGRIVAALRTAKSKNPVMLLDEIDKIGSDYKGDPSSALLEVLDPEQNKYFRDHYVEMPVDLSKVMFICTANTTDTIPRPLLDRMEVIELSGYTSNEKFHIAKEHLIEKQKNANGLTKNQLNISDKAVRIIIENYTREAGVRNLERKIAQICRKAAMEVAKDAESKTRVSERNIRKFLGTEKYTTDMANKEAAAGIARGLAWTSTGGDTLEIEVNIMKGTGKLELTGKLGDVMQESAKIALSYVRSVIPDSFPEEYFEKHDVHLHVPEGAVPKDGPSAGITMATAIYSAVTDKKVRPDVAMTGELTLRGRVLPIGGLKEKILAAKSAGIKLVLVPLKNKKDIDDLEKEILDGISVKYVQHAEEVFGEVLV
ncbi:MAG: endopeptidase La [Lachnospiraceae bacterium]|nr:endopeptidase La [Lachnospiraceae bacterium]